MMTNERLEAAAFIKQFRPNASNEDFETTRRTFLGLFEHQSERDRRISEALGAATTLPDLAKVIEQFSEPKRKFNHDPYKTNFALIFRYRGKQYRSNKLVWNLFYPDNPIAVTGTKGNRNDYRIIHLDGDRSNLDPLNLMKCTATECRAVEDSEQGRDSYQSL